MLIECCEFGTVRQLQLLSPILQSPVDFTDLIPTSHKKYVEGCVSVTFESIDSGIKCSMALNGRCFDSRCLETLLLSSLPDNRTEVFSGSIDGKESTLPPPVPTNVSVANPTETVSNTTPENIDDFLNSLL